MMNKKDIFRKKAVVTSIFVVSIVCLASTAAPAISSSTLKTISEKMRNYNRCRSNINDENILLNFLTEKNFKLLKKGIQDKISKTTSNPDDDFEDYWEDYEKARKAWGSAKSFAEWFYEWIGGIDEGGNYVPGYWTGIAVISAMVVLISLIFGYKSDAKLMAWFVTSLVLSIDVSFLLYYLDRVFKFLNLFWREVDIIIHVIDAKGNGITGLGGNITAYSKNVKEFYPSYIEQFKYELGPLSETNESGWYALHTRGFVEGEGGVYHKAPPPPGRWNVTIDDMHGPWDIGYLDNISISNRGSYVGNITLYPED